jgi:hypothetical protein
MLDRDTIAVWSAYMPAPGGAKFVAAQNLTGHRRQRQLIKAPPLLKDRRAWLPRLVFQSPILLYRVGLGGLLGHQFLLLTHACRRTGRVHETVLKVLHYDPATCEMPARPGTLAAGPEADPYLERRGPMNPQALPFTREAFLATFAAYNQAIWPLQVLAYALALAAVAVAVRLFGASDRLIAAILAVFWLWIGGVFFLGYQRVLDHSPISTLATLGFLVQGVLWF